MSLPAYAKDSLRKILTAAAHLWVTGGYCEAEPDELPHLPEWATYFVYPRDLGWGNELLKGKRVRVQLLVEDDPDA